MEESEPKPSCRISRRRTAVADPDPDWEKPKQKKQNKKIVKPKSIKIKNSGEAGPSGMLTPPPTPSSTGPIFFVTPNSMGPLAELVAEVDSSKMKKRIRTPGERKEVLTTLLTGENKDRESSEEKTLLQKPRICLRPIDGPSMDKIRSPSPTVVRNIDVRVTTVPTTFKVSVETQTDNEKATVVGVSTQTNHREFMDRGSQTTSFPLPVTGLMPYQVRGLAGNLIARYVVFHKFYEAIEVLASYRGYERPRHYPTKWMGIMNPYWADILKPEKLERIGGRGEIESTYDRERVYIETQQDGSILATRQGDTVVVRYSNGTTGGYHQYSPLVPIDTVQCPRQNCVPTASINGDSPYWHNLMGDLVFPSYRGYTKVVHSPDDGIRNAVKVEVNGQLEVIRDGVVIRLRGSGENNF